jgi:thiamine kinase-like enzyme
VDDKNGRLVIDEAIGEAYDPGLEAHRRAAGAWLAALHATRPAPEVIDRLPVRDATFYRDALADSIRNIDVGLDGVKGAAQEIVAGMRSVLEGLLKAWPPISRELERSMSGPVHCDLSESNVRVSDTDSGISLWVFDWEYAGWGPGLIDLACERRPRQVSTLCPDLATYRKTLTEYGVETEVTERSAQLGRVLRLLLSINWASWSLEYPGNSKAVGALRTYRDELAQALDGTT